MAFGPSLAGILGGAGGGTVVGGAIVRLLLDAAQFDQGLTTSQAKLHRTARTMSTVGGTLTRSVTLPVVAAGAASIKMAIDFESAFTKIRANSNLTEGEIAKLRDGVLELATKTGKAPQELAEGLYFLASAGLNAAQVQDVLTQAAKASAAGFGTVADISKLTANAMNAYAKEGLKASEITDTLAAAIREGTAEPDEFANALGRILPAAQKAGVGFDEILASLSSLSNVGLDVNEGVTAMRGLLLALTAPGSQAADTLKEIGLSADEVRSVLAEKGLLAVMKLLEERTGGNIDQLRKLIPNVRAMSGMFGITSQEADKVNQSFKNVIGATGDLDNAFKETKKGAAFDIQQALAELKVLAIEVGTDALPILKDVVRAVGDGVSAFRSLPEPVQDNVVKFGLLAAALGPLLKVGGSVLGVATRLAPVLGSLATAAGPPGLAIAAVVTVLGSLYVAAEESKRQIRGLADAFADGTTKIEDFLAEWEPTLEAMDAAGGLLGKAADGFRDDLASAIDLTKEKLTLQLEELDKLPGALDLGTRKAIEAQIAQGHFTTALTMMTEAEEKARDALNKRGKRMEEAWHETERLMNITERYQAMLKEKKEAEERAAEATRKHDDQLANLGEQAVKTGNKLEEGARKGRDALREANKEAETMAETLRELRDIGVKVNVAFTGPQGDWGASLGGAVGGSAVRMAQAAIDAVPGPQAITSTFRGLGERTASGNLSYHADPNNPAADIGGTNLMGVAMWLMKTYGLGAFRELIFSPLGFSVRHGQIVPPVAVADHYDHVHVADRGKILRGPATIMQGPITEAHIPLDGPAARGWVEAIAQKLAEAGGRSAPQTPIVVNIHGDTYGLDDLGERVNDALTRARRRRGL